jgi:hypothetical protein
MLTIFSAPGVLPSRGLAEFHQARIDAALQQELGVLVDAVVVHAAAAVAAALVAQVELVVLGHKAQAQHTRLAASACWVRCGAGCAWA